MYNTTSASHALAQTGLLIYGKTDQNVREPECAGARICAILGNLLQSLSVEQVGATSIIEVTYKNPSPQRAQQIVNAVGDGLSKRANQGDFVVQNITVGVWDRATLSEAPVSPDPVRSAGIGLVLGLVLGVSLAFLLTHSKWLKRRGTGNA